MHIRPEQANDAAAIESVTAQAFAHAPHSDHTEHFIVRSLRAAGAMTVSLVAEDQGQVLGHVAISLVHIGDGQPHWFGLGPVSVRPDRQGQGIGHRLVEAALQQLQALQAHGCVVLGDPRYYRRFGFAPQAGLTLPGVPAEYFQAVVWRSPTPQGEVRYHAAFDTAA